MFSLLGSTLTVRLPNGERTSVPVSPKPADHAVEWAFVLQHATTIDRYARKLCQDRRLDFEDLRQEAVLWIVRLHGGFDPRRASPSTWIYLMVRRARQALLETTNRRDRHEDPADLWTLSVGDRGASARATEARVLVAEVVHQLRPEERVAADALLHEFDGPEMRAVRLTKPLRDARLRAVAARL